MENSNNNIDKNYELYYSKRKNLKIYPTEFFVRTMLASDSNLKFEKPMVGSSILDTAFLCDIGLSVSGIEITQRIVDQTQGYLSKRGYITDLRVGRNSNIPFKDQMFDYILACHSCYYCDEERTFLDNLKG